MSSINSDGAYFGPRGEPGGTDAGYYNFGEVRSLPTIGKYQALKFRLDHFLIQQFNSVFGLRNSENEPDIPQVLALLTCIAIATIGKIFYPHERNDGGERKEFWDVCTMIDTKLNDPLSDKDLTAFILENRSKNPTDFHGTLSLAELLYSGYRSSFVHSYYMVGVKLSNQQEEAWNINYDPFFLILSPGPFWKLVESKYNQIWNKVIEDETDTRRFSLNAYLSKLLEVPLELI
jgi:hypothetical protein